MSDGSREENERVQISKEVEREEKRGKEKEGMKRKIDNCSRIIFQSV